jgi:hypothetical protein
MTPAVLINAKKCRHGGRAKRDLLMTHLAARSAAINSSRLEALIVHVAQLPDFYCMIGAALAAARRQGLVFSPGESAAMVGPSR